MGLTDVNTNYKEGLVKIMELKIGDVVEFKKYEDLSVNDAAFVPEDKLPKYGKVSSVVEGVVDNLYFSIEGSKYAFSANSVARVVDINDLNAGDEVLVKATVEEVSNGIAQVNLSDVVDILKRKEPEHFIVQEDYYGMYIGVAQELVPDKSVAKIYTSRKTANEDAADMHLNAWDVIKYGA